MDKHIATLLYDTGCMVLVCELAKHAGITRYQARKRLDAATKAGHIQYHPAAKCWTLRSEAAAFIVALHKEGSP